MTTLHEAGIDGEEAGSASARARIAMAPRLVASPGLEGGGSRGGSGGELDAVLAPSSSRRRESWGHRTSSVLASAVEGAFGMGFEPGSQLDRYTIEAVIGEGGMGRVCRAYDTRLQRRVAIKVLHLADGADATDNVASALREARAAAAIAHPNATAVYDADTLDGVPFIVMEFVPGTSLRQIIAGSPVPMILRLRWLVDIAGALTAAHQVGVVHRDIKPENVMVRDDGLVKVLDFGIARRARLTAGSDSHPSEQLSTPDGAGRLVGTPAYMPPEQIRGEPTDGRADQFAWGVLAYELLTGRLPWKSAREFLGYIAAVLTERPEPPRTHSPDIPPQVEAAILRALAKNPANRFPSIAAAAAELAPFVQDAHGPTIVPSPPPPHFHAPAAHFPARAPAPARPPHAPPPGPGPATSSSPLAFEVPPTVPPARPSRPSPSPGPPLRPTGPPAATMPSVSLRRTFEGHQKLREPHFDTPVDLDAHLALLPADAACKGMFLVDLVRLGTRSATASELFRAAQIVERRHLNFHDYPASEHLRLAVAVARAMYPRLALGEGLRRLGQTAFDTVLGSHVGRSLFGILGSDVAEVFLAGPKAMKLLVNFGRFSCEKLGAHTFVFRAREYPAFLETYQIGVIEGALRHCRASGRIRVGLDDLANGLMEVRVG